MRDTIKDKKYFEKYISELDEMIDLNKSSLVEGSIPKGRVSWVKMNTFSYQLNKVIAMFSSGYPIESLKEQFLKTEKDFFSQAWFEKSVKIHAGSDKYLDQYTVEPHGKMLRMLSLAYLLNVSENEFRIIVDQIDQDNISDNLFEFIIKSRLPNRATKRAEEYDKEHSVILKVYNKLREAFELKDKSKAITLVNQFLQKDFNHKYSGYYNSHKSRANVYFGNWSFESAVIVSILGLDDSSLRDIQYYPKDLVDHYRSTLTGLPS